MWYYPTSHSSENECPRVVAEAWRTSHILRPSEADMRGVLKPYCPNFTNPEKPGAGLCKYLGVSTPWSGPKRGHQALPGLLLGLTHAGQTNWFSLMLHDVERTGFQVFRHGGDFIKLPALDFGEEAAELPDLPGKRSSKVNTGSEHCALPGWMGLSSAWDGWPCSSVVSFHSAQWLPGHSLFPFPASKA